jgi:FHA domain
MAVCPNGHDSASDDFCDTCGMRISGSPPSGGPVSGPSYASGASSPAWPDTAGPASAGPASAAEPCPRCGTARSGQFCEACGYNFTGPRFTPSSPAAPAPPPPREAAPPSMSSFPYPQATWTVVVGADRAYYEQVQAVTGAEGAAVAFPSYCAERRFQLVGNQMRIGRRSVSRGLSPEIDLTGPPADPGISRLHAVLIAMTDGEWAVLDPGSANGTLVNGSEIGIGDQVTLHDGDRINLGAWTAITVHRD